jgi:hypothetical protein
MHGYKIWDTYKVDIEERGKAVEALEWGAARLIEGILSSEPILSTVKINLEPYSADDGYNLHELYDFDMEFSADIPFKYKSAVFNIMLFLADEAEAVKDVSRWLAQLDDYSIRFNHVVVAYLTSSSRAYIVYEIDYEHKTLSRTNARNPIAP